ncbi:hypothetical protein V494_07390 [Pseudogymnoascus sp. VKM F-4513 (FW-928)]|nr:hypothetical protein V494_07390 [Pseudogymnoascus sp. VKM F-4513 (FW-928)]
MATAIADFIKLHDLDGVDVDWEYLSAPDLTDFEPGTTVPMGALCSSGKVAAYGQVDCKSDVHDTTVKWDIYYIWRWREMESEKRKEEEVAWEPPSSVAGPNMV